MARAITKLFGHMHTNCRKSFPHLYIRDDDQKRCAVPDDLVSWDAEWKEYDPDDYTMPHVLSGPEWADPPSIEGLKFNTIDGNIDRRSHMGEYSLDSGENDEFCKGRPLNPVGRTGLKGRGTLGKWGPNHAADPIVTRWKRDDAGNKITNPVSQKLVLQFVAIVRRDHGVWAVPGGMVDAGENINVTLKREFSEEAMNTLELPPDQVEKVTTQVNDLFQHGTEVYRGYVDDPRNTDNSWIETVAHNFHDDSGNSVGAFTLNAGDDAIGVKWVDISQDLQLFASHLDFIKKVADIHGCHW
ncbi:NUDT9 [Bugula neritina]|uniref:NUDT9 n=1 Tax=Bugula neritina TaxID=10212 RepID=A0A7J7JD06_BUGNE|nr:NUDT9 [Bugula neritina]